MLTSEEKERMRRSLLILAVVTCFAVAGQAATIVYSTLLSGPNENPPNASPGTGEAIVIYDSDAHTLRVIAEFRDLVAVTATGAPSGVTASHIHCCVDPPGNAGVATTTPTFPGFPSGVTFGSYDATFDLTMPSSYNTGATGFFNTLGMGSAATAEMVLVTNLNAGRTYFNIHSTAFPGGEIRGFLNPVPEPATFALFGAALLGLAAYRKTRKSA
jgi:hypothetical protein